MPSVAVTFGRNSLMYARRHGLPQAREARFRERRERTHDCDDLEAVLDVSAEVGR
jgi:hypothetical protein